MIVATRIKSKRGLEKAYRKAPSEIRDYFEHLAALLGDFPMAISLAYAFSRLELGQNMALYCGVVRIHRVNADIAKNAIGTHHMTRDGFVNLYETVFDLTLPDAARKDLKSAETTRDELMHGKSVKDDDVRNASARVLEFAEEINKQLDKEHGLKPFGNLKGFSGRSKKLDKGTSRFVLKGMGFAIA